MKKPGHFYFRSDWCCLILILFSLKTSGQNFFPNPGFEDLNTCTEYHIECAPEAWFYMKPTSNPLVNGRGVPRPLLGNNLLLVPVYNVFTPVVRPYVYTMLICPLIKGEKYKLTFYINTARRTFYKLDFYFSDVEPGHVKFKPDSAVPTLSIGPANIVLAMKEGWKAIEYEFTATTSSSFCMLGNTSASMPYNVGDIMNKTGSVYYFVDEIKLSPLNKIKVCENYEDRVKLIYAQNYRHTEYEVIDKNAGKRSAPLFIKDTIIIPSIFFENNSAYLKPEFKSRIDSISKNFINREVSKIDIVGHTDANGGIDKNLVLSLARAESFETYFLSKFPQFADITFVSGKGQEQPVSSNATVEGRSKNRRVEIILTLQIKGN